MKPDTEKAASWGGGGSPHPCRPPAPPGTGGWVGVQASLGLPFSLLVQLTDHLGGAARPLLLGHLVSDLGNKILSQKTIPPLAWLSLVSEVSRKGKVLVAHSCLTLCDSMDCSLPGSSVHGTLQVRILEWVAIHFSRGSFQPCDRTQVSCIAGRSEPPGKARVRSQGSSYFLISPTCLCLYFPSSMEPKSRIESGA